MYSLIGTVGTLNTAILSSLLALVIEDNTASYLGYVLSLSIGYLLNAKMNFHHRLSWVEYFRFMSAYIPSFILYAVIGGRREDDFSVAERVLDRLGNILAREVTDGNLGAA